MKANVFMWEWFGCVSFVEWRELALPVFEGWNEAWGAEGKPPVDPGVLPNASKLAKSAFALAFCAAGGGVRMRFRQADEQKHNNKNKQKKTHNERKTMDEIKQKIEWIHT